MESARMDEDVWLHAWRLDVREISCSLRGIFGSFPGRLQKSRCKGQCGDNAERSGDRSRRTDAGVLLDAGDGAGFHPRSPGASASKERDRYGNLVAGP